MKLDAHFDDLKGQSVFVTGGGSGIGAWLTEGFVSQGAKVAFVQRSDATELCDRLEAEYQNRPLFMACDITNIEALRTAIQQARDAHGPITVLVNNAASDNRHGLHEYSVDDWDPLDGHQSAAAFLFTAQEVAGDMRAAGHGSIINFSSISYMMGKCRLPGLCGGEIGDHRPDPRAGARTRRRQHPGQCADARLGADRTAARPLGDPGGSRGALGKTVPEAGDSSRRTSLRRRCSSPPQPPA